MLKAGVFGAGHLGKIHLKLLHQSERFELVGFYDADKQSAIEIEKTFGYKYFEQPEDLIAACDFIDIVTPTTHHYDGAMAVLNAGKHVFIEKPITETTQQADVIIALAHEKGLKGQVGHVERFNPAFTAVKDKIQSPMFIETHRLAEFNPRGTDVPVVLDL